MRTVDAFHELKTLGRPLVETSEAAARLRVSSNTASKALRAIERAGLIRQVHKGLWAIDPTVAPRAAAPYLTAPYPAYVSLWSGLAHHEMIEQIPARIEVASLDRTRTVHTPIGEYAIHRIAPEVFTGFEGDPGTGYLATPEKALFDVVYVRAPRGGHVRFPELTLPATFDRDQLDGWADLVPSARLRTIVKRGVHAALEQADRLAADDY